MPNRYTASYADHRVITPMDQFDKFGFPGKYHSAVAIATTTSGSFTGSGASTGDYGYGYGAVMVGTSANVASSTIHVAGGGIIAGNDLVVGTIYDISPIEVRAYGGPIYVFKRQQ